MHIVALDQFLRLGTGIGGLSGGVGDDQFDGTAADLVVTLLEKQLDAFFELSATGGKCARIDSQKADADRAGLGRSPLDRARSTGNSGNTKSKLTTIEHSPSP